MCNKRDSTKEFATLQGPDPASGPVQTGPCAEQKDQLYKMRDEDLDPQSLLEKQKTPRMSNSAVQRKKRCASISVEISLLMPHLSGNEQLQSSPGADICWRWLAFFFYLMWYKNREIHREFNSYGPKSISV